MQWPGGLWGMVTDSTRDKANSFKKTKHVQSFYLYNFFQRIVRVIHSNKVVSSGFVIDYILHYAGDTDYTVNMEVKKDQNLQYTPHLYSYTWVSCKYIFNKLEIYLFH